MTQTTIPATEMMPAALPRIVELARDVGGMLDDAYAARTDFGNCSDCAELQTDGPRIPRLERDPDPLCDDHAEDLQVAESWDQAVRDLQEEAEWAARDARALDELAAIVRNTTVAASGAELLSRVAAVLVATTRQVSQTTD